MDEETDQIETLLRRWQPREPHDEVRRRIAADLERPAKLEHRWWQRLGFGHPAAAFGWGLALPAMIALFTLNAPALRQPAASPAKPVLPVDAVRSGQYTALTSAQATNRRFATDDEGVVLDANQRPVRRTRYLSEDTLRWRNPQTGAEMEFSYPREDVVMVPVTTR